MYKVIDSASLFYLAQEKAKDLRNYFDPYDEIADKSPEAQTMFFAFLFIEALYREQRINNKAKKEFENKIEGKLQELAFEMVGIRKTVEAKEKSLQEKMQRGEFAEALPDALSLLDFFQNHSVDGRNCELYRHYRKQNTFEMDE